MSIKYIIGTRARNSFFKLFLMMMVLCGSVMIHAQETPTNLQGAVQNIKIGGNVYGGGNAGNTGGSATVTVRMGDIDGNVFGGARMANVAGSTFVNIDGEHAPDNTFILINRVYGGNDIAGTIGTSTTIPTELTGVIKDGMTEEQKKGKNDIDNTWNAFVRVSSASEGSNQRGYIGQLFGGGNGEYFYYNNSGTHQIYESEKDFNESKAPIATTTEDFIQPSIDRTYLEIVGGSIVYAYGGGNNATINQKTVIYVDNSSHVVNSIEEDKSVSDTEQDVQLLTMERIKRMGINTTFSHPTSGEYQIGSFFGGNNKADMAIRPTWNLKKGKIRNIYSGGNEGRMTSPDGLLLEIREDSELEADYIYGGCRKADVRPLDAGGNDVATVNNLPGYYFPAGYAARTLIRGGKHINNVYGGNDISGRVYFGSALGVYTTIYGDVYGGGNGSYPYTDNSNLKGDQIYGDFYYGDFKTENNYTSSVDALNDFRPNAEQVSLRLAGTEPKKTIIHGGVYVGGNSATLKPTSDNSTSELKIGSYVIADKVFLGNNGENMVKYNVAVVDQNTQEVKENEGVLRTYTRDDLTSDHTKFTSLDLTNAQTFANYMDGCAMTTKPSVVFDDKLKGDPDTYIDYTTYIGSFFCGGNVGSITKDGKLSLNINHPLVIFDKLVGGSNNAVVPAVSPFNAEYVGGIIGSPEDGTNDKFEINLAGLKIEPKRWAVQRDADYNIVKDANNNPQYLTDNGTDNGNHYLEWNTQLNDKDCPPVTASETYPITSDVNTDNKRRLVGGNIYGGCCESGVVNGNIIINLNASIVERFKLFDEVEKNADDGEDRLYGDNPLHPDQYKITERRTGVIMSEQGMDVLGKALNVFGGGKGAATEIWGSTTINMNKGYVFQVFGGSEEGIIGKTDPTGDYTFTYAPDKTKPEETVTKKLKYDNAYSCYVNLKGAAPGVSKRETYNENMPECEFIYGGSFMGKIAGNTVVRLGNGRIFNSFAGSCYADILGHTETYIGYRHTYKDETNNEVTVDGFPWVRDYTYGGNDLGGQILGSKNYADRLNEGTISKIYGYTNENQNPYQLTASAYTEYRQGRAVGIFGGAYGTYDYKSESGYNSYTNQPFLGNAFINFRPTITDELKSNVNNVIDEIYGAGQGYPGDGDADKMQNSSYILIDIPQEMTNFKNTKVFGAGAWSGLGIRENVPADDSNDATKIAARNGVSAIIDLVHGQLATAYGGSYREGVTRRSVINVPTGSTIAIGSIFGGAYGTDTYSPCDVYEANVNYNSADAILIYDPATNERYQGAIYGGNNHERRTLYGRVNIGSKVVQKKVIQYKDEIKGMEKGQVLTTTATIYGAGRGANTWSEYTLVNLQNGAEVYEVYGGGQNGKVFNAESIENYIIKQKPNVWPEGSLRAGEPYSYDQWKYAWTLGGNLDIDGWDASWPQGGNYTPSDNNHYWQSSKVNLKNPLVRRCEVEDRRFPGVSDADKALVANKNNANVIINQGAKVNNYAYGGGYGAAATVSGTTYIALLGGEVQKDIYAGGTSGSVADIFNAGTYSSTNPSGFVANATAYVESGTVRNVYGGGWRGSVGYHNGEISNIANDDRDGEAHVVIGKQNGTSYTDGIPSITRNVYGGGEGGAIYGDAYVTVNNGYIGYRYKNTGTEQSPVYKYVEELDDATPGDNLLDKGGNVFGGGYVANSYVDRSYVTMYGGIVRGSLYGGGEVGPIGRGTVKAGAPASGGTITNADAKIYKGGQTNVYLYNGHVMRDVFGGGRGYDNWGGEGYMTDEEKETMDRSSKGYVFGSTNVYIRGGEIGTEQGALYGYGNVFGGGNEGFVYSDEGKKVGTQSSDDNLVNGKPADGGGFYYKNGVIANGLSLDCNVVIEPYCKVFGSSVTIGSDTYPVGSYVPVEALNKLKNKNADNRWSNLYKGDNKDGIIVHNAIFAGGNITEGSDKLFANTTTVYGNVAASLRDVYNRDLISIGTDELGGIYGDGNLTLVDGFRELHIDNYGTDYYSLDPNVVYNDYEKMSDREKAYYQLKYVANSNHTYTYWESKSLHTYKTVAYRKGQKVTQSVYDTFETDEKANWAQGVKHYSGEINNKDEIDDVEWSLMDEAERANWTLAGVFSIYAGRPMNTIQRADMCGVFGSRMVLQGAQDRVPQVVDYNDYTINRVDEVSLNKRTSEAGDDGSGATHGNYFGIYNSVNYLGNLTSDVRFQTDADVRQTTSTSHPADNKTYYGWKADSPQSSYRNNGTSHNKVALASGVYLELKRTEGELTGTDDWGYITGVVELDLINVMQGMGGGYVYAKNEHGAKEYHSNYDKVTLLSYNDNAATYRKFTYNENSIQTIETSGNFVHSGKQIVDDCYPNSGMYTDGYVASPAHYWFIKGSIYVYDQYISAYTGSANAYAEKVELPLTIAAASNGKLTLREVQPNYYAYYDKMGKKLGTEGAEETLVIKNKTYHLNDPISYWDYRLLSDADKDHFEQETYTTIAPCKIGETSYPAGYTLLPSEYTTMKAAHPKVYHEVQKQEVDFDFVFRPSNNLGHNTGYVLTFDINNPGVWDNYYSKTSDASESEKLNTKQYNNLTSGVKSNYTEGPTFTPKAEMSNVYGQKQYNKGSIIYNTVKTTYDNNVYSHLTEEQKAAQAQVEQAYVVTDEIEVKDGNTVVQVLNPGVAISRHSGYPVSADQIQNYTDAQWEAITSSGKAVAAKVCTSLIEFDATDYVWAGKVLSPTEVETLEAKIRAKYEGKWTAEQFTNYFNRVFENAWYCYQAGPYGGSYFEAGKAYRALETFSAMSKEDRDKFDFNYDALDLLVDPTYSGRLEANYGDKPQYDGWDINGTKISDKALNTKIYSVSQPVDYTAECTVACSYTDEDSNSKSYSVNANPTNWLTREQYEDIPNEKRYYSPIIVKGAGNYYVTKKVFMRGDIPYTAGQQIEESVYNSLTTEQKKNIDVFNFTNDYAGTEESPKTYYYCHQSYTINEHGEGKTISTLPITKNEVSTTEQTYSSGNRVDQGVIIRENTENNKTGYNDLVNKQTGFIIHGTSPTEVSTLYVSSESDIYDLSKEKIITVIYLYEYEESDASGLNVTPISERHIVNIHINFKSGVPQIDQLKDPSVVLPGTTVVLETPTFSEGAYRVTESGWELFTNQSDAETHTNGQEFRNNETPMYWYQNGYWVAYYAKTYLGKTYSNPVQFKVANYHDLKKVMGDKQHHYFIDHQDVDYAPKIYINNYKVVNEQGQETAESKNGLDLLKQLFDLTYANTAIDGHQPLDSRIRGGNNLEFFLRTNLDHTGTAWTPIANNDGECFSGTLHGDGHTITGLDHSFINRLCGDVYNLGVTGSFTSAGVAETGEGYVENCWISTSSTDAKTSKPVFHNPTKNNYVQIVNSYYMEEDGATNKYENHSGTYGKPTRKTAQAFYNGEVTYDLNGFYLYKRYNDGVHTASGVDYKYYTLDENGNILNPQTPLQGYYANNMSQALCSSGYNGIKYVEDRFADGDFVYANGTIPEEADRRLVTDGNGNPVLDGNGKLQYLPIWPTDYLFFGQTLNYGHVENVSHEDVPSAVDATNRVFRAPAYFGNKTMSVAHFNPNAIFAKTKKGDANVKAYEGMTAIDFTGYSDASYQLGWNDNKFYTPLLDDGGLTDFTNVDLTSNLLAYTDNTSTATAEAAQTNTVVAGKLTDKAYAEVNTTYHTVAPVTDVIRGHWVQKTNEGYRATRDHFLVDKEDFNSPIAYNFDSDHRMWYQRMPDNFVEPVFEEETRTRTTKGWEGISLPFTAEMVTTNSKGEITHFYNQGENWKGHEYWLRHFTGIDSEKSTTEVKVANFNKLEQGTTDKEYTNTFLWDYYYKYNNYDDMNLDKYPGTYYSSSRTYTKYPRLACATPYIIGFPGERYYEFDLSGNFEAKTAKATTPAKLSAQVITFVSPFRESVHVSDEEIAEKAAAQTNDGYAFVTNFTARTLEGVAYVLNSDDTDVDKRGNSYKKVDNGAQTVPFRPYFVAATTTNPARQMTRSIVFSDEQTQLEGKDDHDLRGEDTYSLSIYAKRNKIFVESNLRETTEVRIVNTAGITITSFDIEPGETIETRIYNSGVYIVQTSDGRYNKKLAVR